MSEHTHELAGADFDALLMRVWMSGFKSGVGTMVANQLGQMTDDLRKMIAETIAAGVSHKAFEDPASRLIAESSIQQTVECHLHPGAAHQHAHRTHIIKVQGG